MQKSKNSCLLPDLYAGLPLCILVFAFWISAFAQDIKEPNVSGAFYPADPEELTQMIDGFLENAAPQAQDGEVFALISPHAGYGFSGQVAAFGYKLIQDKPYKTVIVIGASHHYAFNGASIYPEGAFRTPLGSLEIDKEFTRKLLYKDKEIFFEPAAFGHGEHSLEVQLPFLQRTLSGFKIVPIIMGQGSFSTCRKLADLLKEAIGNRKDVLVVASSDMAHRYDYEEVEKVDNLTLAYLEKMDTEGLYNGFLENRLEMCGMFPVVTTLILSKELGHKKLKVLKHTDSSEVTGKKAKGTWAVGYGSCAIDREKGDIPMLSKEQKIKLLTLARNSIQAYLKTGEKLQLTEDDPVLLQEMGAFVTLHNHGELRGCIGHIIGDEPLYLTIRDMAVESAVGDPRFTALTLSELKDVQIEISVLSPLKKIDAVDEIKLGFHGVLVKKGFYSGVFLPQVATETGWPKEEFLSNLCSHKAGLSPDAWKDKSTEIYIFTAEIFSEESY